jgi:chemotaxis protein methyltransferase CheR
VIGKPEDLRLEVEEYRLLREIINRHSGIYFSIDSRSILERKLRDRIVGQRFSSFAEYCQFLRSDDGKAELNEAVDLVTVNETYFFREDYQLRCFQAELLPSIAREIGPKGRLHVWSAGCSTGEEVYTIAALVKESGLFTQAEVSVFGSDISRRCISTARRAVYGASSFRQTPPELKRRYFVDRPDGIHVADELRALCNFGQINLVNPERAAVVGRVQVIFCRNVLIYFDNASRRRVIEMFYERLVPGGYLLLGHAESLLNVSTAFELVHLREDLVYRKPVSMSWRSHA